MCLIFVLYATFAFLQASPVPENDVNVHLNLSPVQGGHGRVQLDHRLAHLTLFGLFNRQPKEGKMRQSMVVELHTFEEVKVHKYKEVKVHKSKDGKVLNAKVVITIMSTVQRTT